jgi:hypothetical protein
VTTPRDWDKELAAIDRAIEHAPAPAAPPATPVAAASLRGSASRAWARVGLVLALAAALPFWPYPRDCGIGLVMFLGAVGILLIAGIWGAVVSWKHRRPVAHVLALAAVAWGAALTARELLPRVGYARVSATWTC